jgi:hypothetical protein
MAARIIVIAFRNIEVSFTVFRRNRIAARALFFRSRNEPPSFGSFHLFLGLARFDESETEKEPIARRAPITPA